MLWTHYKIAALFTSSTILLSYPTGQEHTPFISSSPPPGNSPWCIYLSFDDGPSAGSRMVNLLSRQDSIAINVFLIGHNACLNSGNRDLVNDYKTNPLVELGNHSYTHADRRYRAYFAQPLLVLADVNRCKDSLQLNNGLVRLPGRNFFRLDGLSRNDLNNGSQAADTLAANGYRIFGWDLEWRDKAGKGIHRHSSTEMLAIVTTMLEDKKTFLPGHIVILLHDHDLLDEPFREELDTFIHHIRMDDRFRFSHLSSLSHTP